jgi:hypothetical protein
MRPPSGYRGDRLDEHPTAEALHGRDGSGKACGGWRRARERVRVVQRQQVRRPVGISLVAVLAAIAVAASFDAFRSSSPLRRVSARAAFPPRRRASRKREVGRHPSGRGRTNALSGSVGLYRGKKRGCSILATTHSNTGSRFRRRHGWTFRLGRADPQPSHTASSANAFRAIARAATGASFVPAHWRSSNTPPRSGRSRCGGSLRREPSCAFG